MSVSVRIPTILRTYTSGESEVTAEGDTLAAVLDDLDANYAGIKGRVLDEGGELRRFVNVYVGNDDVRFLDNLATPTPDGTQISVIPAVAGRLSAGRRDDQRSATWWSAGRWPLLHAPQVEHRESAAADADRGHSDDPDEAQLAGVGRRGGSSQPRRRAE